jgi:tetratricopeptide (TPR) repeat protein
MQLTFRRWLQLAVLVGLCAVFIGCTSTKPKSPLAGLPSPWATVKAAENKDSEPTKRKGATQKSEKKTDAEQAAEGQLSLDILRGRGMEKSGDYEKARKLYEGLRKQHPENLELVHRLGVVADAERRHAEAEGMFQFVLQREPRNAEVLADLGYCYFLQGQLTKAESALLKAVAAEPSNPRFRNNLGLVIGHQGRHEEALAHFQEGGTEADAYYNLAFIYATQDQAEKAKQCFLMALNEDPTHGKAREALRSFENYERLPDHLKDDESLLADGRVRYVPFVEGGDEIESGVRQAGLERALPTSRDVSQTNRSLQTQSRGMLNRNMQSQRNEAPVEFIEQ